MPFSIIVVLIVPLSITLLIIPLLIKLFSRKSIVDRKNRRKIHLREVPTMGGTGFFLAFILTILLLGTFEQLAPHRVELLTMSVMFVVGLRDDLIELKPISKLIAQLVPALLLIYLTSLVFTSLNGFLGIYTIPYWAGLSLSLITIVGLTNSFNLIDGLDGLAGSLALLASVVFGIWFYVQGIEYYSFIAFAFAGSLAGFIYYNWQPAKIFMGDTGALVIGFLLSILAIKFIDINARLSEGTQFKFNSGIAFAISVLIIPVFDTIRIIAVRLLSGKPLFSADNNHTHHLLLRLGLSHSRSTLLLLAINLGFIGFIFFLDFLGDNILIPILAIMALTFSLVLKVLIDRKISMQRYNGKSTWLEVIKSERKVS